MNNNNRFIDDKGLSESTSLTHLLSDDDSSDTIDMNIIKHSPYYSESDFHNLQFRKGSLSILSLNCQSINAKFDELQLFMDRINRIEEVSVLCLQETWTSDKDDISLFQLSHYKLLHRGKQCCKHGGLFIYVHDRFNVKPLDLPFTCTKWEGYCIKISQTEPFIKHHIIANIYKPPYEGSEDFDVFLKEFNDFVNLLQNYGHSSHICGDFNINLLKIHSKPHYNAFFENMLSSGFYPKITLPTRICDTSSTIIDNIYCNEIDCYGNSGIFINHISDHQAIFTTTSTKFSIEMQDQYVTIQTNDDASLNNFVTELRNMNITDSLNNNVNANPSKNYDTFIKLLQDAKDKHLPVRKIKFNKYKHKKNKWITRGILKSIKTKNKLYKVLRQTDTEDVEAFESIKIRFNRFHNILRQSIKEAKRIYFVRTFERFKYDIKQTWSTINETLHRKKKKSLPSVFSHNGKMLRDSVEIANSFNQYFIDIGPSLANRIDSNRHFRDYLRTPSVNQLTLRSIDENKISQAIEHLKNKSSSGIDGISNNLIKMARCELIKPLTKIINQMLHTGIFPEQLKISKVLPLHKANDKMSLTNYRPIALLPSISKIFECVLLEQLTNHFTDNNLLSPQQYGFRVKHSTELAALNLVDYLTYKLDTGKIPINIYIDLSKAFDTLIHDILLDKMSFYGVNGVAKKLLKSYLTQRQQIVECNGFQSDSLEIKTGIPQGSVLGPFLFSVYINDLPLCTDMFNMIMYADDTTLFCDINSIPDVEHSLNAELSKITDWLAANKLSLNASKTKFMVFHSDKKTVRYPKLHINATEIERTDHFNFLGLQLNHNLKWNTHINCVSLKISKVTGLLYKLKSVYPITILKSIYNTLVLPHINYCILSWGSQIDRIHLLQKRAIRNISKSNFRAHTEPLFKEHNLLKVQDIYYIAVLKFYFKLVNNHLPHYFNNFTPQFSAGHQHYNFRNPTRLLPKIKHEFPRQSLRYRLIVTLNETSDDILEMATTQSQKCFIKFIRERIVDDYSYTCNLVICRICDGR